MLGPSEGYLRDKLGDRLYALADFWLIAASEHGDVTYVVGSTHGKHTGLRQIGIVELIRCPDQSIKINAFQIDPESLRRVGGEIRGKLSQDSNSAIDTITLAWLSKLLDSSDDAREAGPAAYQEIAAGGRMIYRKTSLDPRALPGSA